MHHASPTVLEEEEPRYGPPHNDYISAGQHGEAISSGDGRPKSPASSAEVQFAGKGA